MHTYAYICKNMQKVCKNMQKYAWPWNTKKYAKICKIYANICKHMQNMQSRILYAEYALPTLLTLLLK